MEEPEGARLVGINLAPGPRSVCFGVGVAMAAVTGSLISMLFELTPFIGLPYTVTALVVVILGGLGNVLGSVGRRPRPRAGRDGRACTSPPPTSA